MALATAPATVHLSHPAYRADIDGLRALAVLSVVGFHAFPDRVAGGFVGVDVFFVISGYLISTIIFANVESRSFSLIEFYDRRVRRIFPALLLVLVVCLGVGWFALLADEYMQLGKHVAGASLFLSNFILWGESGYFDEAAETKPLLHLWSLAIEEQFYLFWPLLTALAWRNTKRFLWLSVTIAAVSFALGIYLLSRQQSAAFYSPVARFWELMAGSVLAYLALHRPHWLARRQHLQSALGVLAVTAGVILIDRLDPFPGWWALLPTAGAVLVIAAGPGAWLNANFLASKILVWFGLISYPLYLWHWPLLSFARIVTGREASWSLRAAAVAAAVLLAWITYRYVERPVRFGARRRSKALLLLALMVVLGLSGYQAFRRQGLPFRSSSAALKVQNQGDLGQDEYFRYATSRFPPCAPEAIRREAPLWNGHIRCLQSKLDQPAAVAVVGDSHAEHLYIGLAERLAGQNVVYYARNGIPLLSNGEFRRIFRHLLADASVRKVIIAAFWAERITDREGFRSGLAETVERLVAAGKKVYLVDDPPNFSFSPRKCKYADNWFHRNQCAEDSAISAARRAGYRQPLESVGALRDVTVLDSARYFCRESSCAMDRNGRLLFRDRHHLNINGSQYLAQSLVVDHPELQESP